MKQKLKDSIESMLYQIQAQAVIKSYGAKLQEESIPKIEAEIANQERISETLKQDIATETDEAKKKEKQALLDASQKDTVNSQQVLVNLKQYIDKIKTDKIGVDGEIGLYFELLEKEPIE